jgi:ferredoxin
VTLDIDWTRCDGHGVCAELLPARITRDEWGYPVISSEPLSAVEQKNARRAIAACPALALRLTRT